MDDAPVRVRLGLALLIGRVAGAEFFSSQANYYGCKNRVKIIDSKQDLKIRCHQTRLLAPFSSFVLSD
jgi:hypothetical protein